MKSLLVFASLAAFAYARPEPPVANFYAVPQSSYRVAPQSSYAQPSQSSGYSAPSQSYGTPSSDYGVPNDQQVVHKHVYVHVAPDEPKPYRAPKTYRAPQPREKHYKIIFIKAPTDPTPQIPELPELPPQPETKTLVYVLLKRPEPQQEIVLPQQQPTKPSKPEVYFIRYKTPQEGGYPASVPNDSYGAPASQPAAAPAPGDSYGPPSQ